MTGGAPGAPPEAGTRAAPRPRPESLWQLYAGFTLLALQGFGGVLAVVQRELVERRRWLTPEEFIEDWAVAQIMPGPNVVNLSVMLGDRYFGWRGAAVGFAGMLSVPLVVMMAIAVGFSQVADTAVGQRALRGMGAVAAGLICATGLKLAPALRASPMGYSAALAVAVMTFVLVGLVRVPLAAVLAGVGSAACAITWWRLR